MTCRDLRRASGNIASAPPPVRSWPHCALQPRATRSISPHDHPCRLTPQNRHLRVRSERLCLLLRSGRCRHGPSRTPTPTVRAVPLLQLSVAVMLLTRTLLRLRMPQKRALWKRCSGLMSQRQHVLQNQHRCVVWACLGLF